MKSQDALPPAVEALIAHERAPSPVADDLRARLLSRADEAVRLDVPPPRALHAPRPFRRPLIAAVGGLALLAGVAAVLRLTARHEPPPFPVTPSVVIPAPPPAAVEVPVAPAAPVAPIAPTPAPSSSSSSRTRSAPSSRSDDSIDELSLLTRARQADARGDYGTVLQLVSEHAQMHPGGRLAEEREVLRVKALVGLGRQAQARRAAAQFHRQFPRSVLSAKVDEMVP